VFIPTKNNSDEGEGYLICTAYRGQENSSDLLVLDAQNVQDGPLATAKLPHRIPFGFHGNWRDGN
jgi:carotenoid cleavage dioxygenase